MPHAGSANLSGQPLPKHAYLTKSNKILGAPETRQGRRSEGRAYSLLHEKVKQALGKNLSDRFSFSLAKTGGHSHKRVCHEQS